MESSTWACTSMTQCMSWSICLANNYIIPKFSHSYLLLSCFYLFLLPRLENCLVDFRLKLGSAAPPVPLPCPRFLPARKQLRRGLHFQTCAALTWSVASSWLCLYFFAFWFIRPSRRSFPLAARGRRPSSSSSCRSSSPLLGPAKHEGPIKAIQSSWTCSSLVSLLGLFVLFLSEVLEATCLFVFFLQRILCDANSGSWSKRLLSTDMASSKQIQEFSGCGGKRSSSTAMCWA